MTQTGPLIINPGPYSEATGKDPLSGAALEPEKTEGSSCPSHHVTMKEQPRAD